MLRLSFTPLFPNAIMISLLLHESDATSIIARSNRGMFTYLVFVDTPSLAVGRFAVEAVLLSSLSNTYTSRQILVILFFVNQLRVSKKLE